MQDKLNILANNMEKLRNKYSKILQDRINKELEELEMPSAKIKIRVEKILDYNQNGLNNVEFYIKTNVGEESKKLTKIASGGELSRIMLVIKTIFADVDNVETMVFDEIDTGISGVAAKAVAQKLKVISKKHQIFVITHLAVIAASGEYNYYINKDVENGKTKTHIKLLDNSEATKEIARIATGEINEVTIKYAKELIKSRKHEYLQ